MNKLINSRKFRLLLACISLIMLFDLIQDTYAKYITSADASNNFTIARWALTVNSQDVVNNNDFSNTIIPTFDVNANIASGVIAPTSTGYFEVVIDSSNVDVAFDEIITLSSASTNTVTDLVFTGYQKNSGSIIDFDNNTTTITTNHNLNEVTTTNTYKFFIEWIDGNDETMDNADDTEASAEGVAAINVNIQFIQRANSSSGTSNPSSGSE